uniref:Uncharacterized protein n=1 Tax=uncultured marine virus TaxID=186617 RepID=A0A0F7L4K7_9VIRU|nr:hypothetical protein [uncultured marine virus]
MKIAICLAGMWATPSLVMCILMTLDISALTVSVATPLPLPPILGAVRITPTRLARTTCSRGL